MDNQSYQIENSLLAKKEFLQLSKLLNRFNIFEATDMGRREIKHTKFLSYLLDPNESHGLGEVFLKNFIIRLSNSIINFPRILDLDFSFAEIKAEYKVKEKENHSLDCFIKIPLRGLKEKNLYIAIENKIDSGQGVGQLKKYSESLRIFEEDYLHKIYLTFNEEDPNEQDWENVIYDDVVLPTVSLTIELIEETGSTNLKAALNDYLELLIEDEDGNKQKELLANHLIIDPKIKSYFESGKKNREKHFGDLYVKHKKVVDYICKLNSDMRTPCLKWWNNSKKNIEHSFKYDGYNQELIARHESSVRSYLRFSVLTESNRKRLSKLSIGARSWLDGGCPIAFEIIIGVVNKKIVENNQKTTDKEPIKFSCGVTLTLGPLDSNVDRLKLYNHLFNALKREKSDFIKKEINTTGAWNKLISNKNNEWIKGKITLNDNPIKWVQENVLIEKNNSFELAPWIKDLSLLLNRALDNYFEAFDEKNI